MLLAVLSLQVSAQEVVFTTESVVYDGKERMSVSTIIAPEPDVVKEAFEDWMKDEYDVKMKGSGLFTDKDVLTAEEAKVSVISPKFIDFYARSVPSGDQTQFSVFASFGYNVHIEPETYPQEFAAMQDLHYAFVSEFLPQWYQEQIGDTEEVVADLSDDIESFKDDMDKNLKDQAELREEMEEMKQSLQQTEVQLSETMARLEILRSAMQRINASLKQSQNNDL